ncbi:MAG: DegT/DnrJ/EryC1/StrS family aminotransferase [Pirellulales bacterium]
MQRPTHDPQSLSGRRGFLKSAGAAAAGLYLAGSQPVAGAEAPAAQAETLAINGGKRAVTYRNSGVFRWPRFGQAEKNALVAALDENTYYPNLQKLEEKWRKYNGVPFAKTHMNGTSALLSMYFALKLPPGSEIMVPSYTFFGTITTMRFFGYVPVFVDINPRTATFDVEHAKKVLNPRVRAVVPMHSWGLPCEMDHICDFAKEHDLIVLEDCAHAHGASMQGKKVGCWGRMGIYSFQATKTLPGIEGGMGVYQKREDYERATTLGHYEACTPGTPVENGGFSADSPYLKYAGTGLGLKLRMHPLAAVLLLKQMETIDKQNAIIASQVRRLNDRVCQLPGLAEPVCRKDQERVYYSSNLLFLDEAKAGVSRDAVVKALQAEGVSASSGAYPENHRSAIYAEPEWWHHPVDVPKVLPGCQQVNARAINVALFRQEAPELVDQYAKAFEKVWAHRNRL